MTERNPYPRWATEAEAADHARVSVFTIRRRRADGTLTAHKIGRRTLYDLNEIDRMITNATPDSEEQRSAAHQDA